MDWSKCKKLLWNVVFLFGVGFVIVDGVWLSGLVDVLLWGLNFLEMVLFWVIVFMVCFVGGIIIEFVFNNVIIMLLFLLLI